MRCARPSSVATSMNMRTPWKSIIDARRLRVLDRRLSQGDREEVQTRMLGPEVLDANRFDEIRLVSSISEKTRDGWIVRGQLTLHGQTRPLAVTVTAHGNRYTGTA